MRSETNIYFFLYTEAALIIYIYILYTPKLCWAQQDQMNNYVAMEKDSGNQHILGWSLLTNKAQTPCCHITINTQADCLKIPVDLPAVWLWEETDKAQFVIRSLIWCILCFRCAKRFWGACSHSTYPSTEELPLQNYGFHSTYLKAAQKR